MSGIYADGDLDVHLRTFMGAGEFKWNEGESVYSWAVPKKMPASYKGKILKVYAQTVHFIDRQDGPGAPALPPATIKMNKLHGVKAGETEGADTELFGPG